MGEGRRERFQQRAGSPRTAPDLPAAVEPVAMHFDQPTLPQSLHDAAHLGGRNADGGCQGALHHAICFIQAKPHGEQLAIAEIELPGQAAEQAAKLTTG